MSTRYTSLPYTDTSSAAAPLVKSEDHPSINSRGEDTMPTSKRSLIAWAGVIWAMIVHCILSAGIAMFVLVYVDHHHFNLTERYPSVNLFAGTQNSPFLLMQSDIVTLLSSMIAISKCALTAWAGLLSWNAALFLMERRGLPRRDFRALLKYGLLSPGVYSKDWSTWVIGALLVASLAAGFTSPVLTGSISWAPSNRLVHGLSDFPYSEVDALDGTIEQLPQSYLTENATRAAEALRSAGVASLAWERDTEKGVLKRVNKWTTQLAANTTVQNVTLPYFKVHSIRWIENGNEDPRIANNQSLTSMLGDQSAVNPTGMPAISEGAAILFPNVTTDWSSDPLDSVIVHDTRLLVFYCGYVFHYKAADVEVSITQSLPSNAYKVLLSDVYFSFAWVTFSAGVGQCKNHHCIITNPFTIRSDGPIEPEPHQLTFQALALAPVVSIYLALQNVTLPFFWDNVDDYVEAVLVRSYSGAWNELNSLSRTAETESSYVPALASLLANVDHQRVYMWLAVQLLVTALSVVYLVMYSRLSKYALIKDTSLLAFELDTTAVPSDTTDSSGGGVRKIEQRGDRLRVKDE